MIVDAPKGAQPQAQPNETLEAPPPQYTPSAPSSPHPGAFNAYSDTKLHPTSGQPTSSTVPHDGQPSVSSLAAPQGHERPGFIGGFAPTPALGQDLPAGAQAPGTPYSHSPRDGSAYPPSNGAAYHPPSGPPPGAVSPQPLSTPYKEEVRLRAPPQEPSAQPPVQATPPGPISDLERQAQVGALYQQQLFAQCAAGVHDARTEYGMGGIIGAVLCFPIGLLFLLCDQREVCRRCHTVCG